MCLLLWGRSCKIDFGGGGGVGCCQNMLSAQKCFICMLTLVDNSQISTKYKGCDSFLQLYSIQCAIIDLFIKMYSFLKQISKTKIMTLKI